MTARQKLLDTLCEGVFSTVTLIRQGGFHLIVPDSRREAEGFVTVEIAEQPFEEIALWERVVEDDELWAQFMSEDVAARHRSQTPVTIYDAYPELTGEAALKRASANDMILQNLKTLNLKFTGPRAFGGGDGDIYAAFGAMNRAADQNLQHLLTRRHEIRHSTLRWLRLAPAVWPVYLLLAPIAHGEAGMMAAAGIGGLSYLVTLLEGHYRLKAANSDMTVFRSAFRGNAHELSVRIGQAAARRHADLTRLRAGALEKVRYCLARRRDRGEARHWITAMNRWKIIATQYEARLEGLREALRIHLGLHAVVYRWASDWASYLDVYYNRKDPRKVLRSYVPPVPRSWLRNAWWTSLMGGAVAIGLFWVMPQLTGALSDGGTLAAIIAATGLALSSGLSVARTKRITDGEAVDASFVQDRVDQMVAPEMRQEMAEAFETDMQDLVQLLAEWTHPDTDRPNR